MVDISAAALYFSNVVFAFRATDYFAAGSAPSPILHFWSLGVEEQFYLFWPAIFLLVAYGAKKLRMRIGLCSFFLWRLKVSLLISMSAQDWPYLPFHSHM